MFQFHWCGNACGNVLIFSGVCVVVGKGPPDASSPIQPLSLSPPPPARAVNDRVCVTTQWTFLNVTCARRRRGRIAHLSFHSLMDALQGHVVVPLSALASNESEGGAQPEVQAETQR